MTDNFEDRRGFKRYPHRADGELDNGKTKGKVHIINLSQEGALLINVNQTGFKEEDKVDIDIIIDEYTSFEMRGRIAHIKDDYIGLDCSARGQENKEKLSVLLKKLESMPEE